MSTLKDSHLAEVPQVLDDLYREIENEFENACEIIDSPECVPASIYYQARVIQSLSAKLMAILNVKKIWGVLEELFED